MSTHHETSSGREVGDGPQLQTSAGFLTQPRSGGISPAMLAEQQRARSLIEAALTIASHNPRDERRAMDGILVTCQRPGIAAKSQYEYSRGGTAISGPSIVLLTAIAQRWGNLDYGFRELSHYPGRGNQPGESVIEAFAWDLESNTRRTVTFAVEHVMKSGNHLKVLTDPRDIYEWISNQAQRRVRTCLENVIPRDIIESACEECDRTLQAHIDIGPKTIAQLLERFASVGVTKDQIEARIQRRIDSITPAQILHLGKIFTSIKDGMSVPEDWFDMPVADAVNKPQTAVEKAKEAMRKASATGTVDQAPPGSPLKSQEEVPQAQASTPEPSQPGPPPEVRRGRPRAARPATGTQPSQADTRRPAPDQTTIPERSKEWILVYRMLREMRIKADGTRVWSNAQQILKNQAELDEMFQLIEKKMGDLPEVLPDSPPLPPPAAAPKAATNGGKLF